jgi:hypothetical protein
MKNESPRKKRSWEGLWSRRLFCGWAALAAGFALSQRAHSHPDHVALADVAYNAKNKAFEIALRIKPEDLERALSRISGAKVRIEDEAALVPLKAYLQQTFALTAQKKALAHNWVGMEMQSRFAWLYFEIPVRHLGPNAQLELRFDTLLDIEDEQVNTATIRIGASRQSLRFHAGQRGPKSIDVPKALE